MFFSVKDAAICSKTKNETSTRVTDEGLSAHIALTGDVKPKFLSLNSNLARSRFLELLRVVFCYQLIFVASGLGFV